MTGKLIVISAPSGAGKSSLIKALRAELGDGRVAYSVSHTTRAPRPGELEGRDYHFVSQGEFDAMAERGEFLEWARTYGSSYGTSKALIDRQLASGRTVIADVDVVGATNIRGLCPTASLVFIAPPSFSVLKRRLLARKTDSPEAIARRLGQVEEEVGFRGIFDFLVVNDDFQEALAQLRSIVTTGEGPPMRDDGFWASFFAKG
jgi:guanylate kinase